jgi:hypothetical protein
MVAQVNHEVFSTELLTPQSVQSDSDQVRRSLESARGFETSGDLRQAVRWLRHAADLVEKQGDDSRVLVLARAAADLSNKAAGATPAPASPPRPSNDVAPKERSMRIGSVRIAFAGSMQEDSFVVHRLAFGQPVPEGMTEAMLVLTGGVEGRVEIETTLRVVDRGTKQE